ncbi:MAG TPA: glycoside hydrolase family 38 C-terminal domain-containing protein [Gemmatimonadaceae bacterium]|nr:glycoside hydrolase family 38 C-terminal domain-containing protein [Gemmatimonadaceae bacterium]
MHADVRRIAAPALAILFWSCEHAVPAPAIATGSCDAPISEWLLAGPFPLDTGALRLDRSDIGNPAELFVSAGDSVPGTRAMRWRAESSDSLGRVDLYSVFRDPRLDDRAAYALTYIRSPDARTVRLAVESDDDVVIWLNGRRVLRRQVARELRSGADTISLALASGDNRLLYRVVNRGGGFGLGARLLAISRDPIGDLRSGISAAARDGARRVSAGDTARGPAARAAVTLGPVTMAPRAEILRADAPRDRDARPASTLGVQLRVCATRWASTRGRLSLDVGAARVPLPRGEIGKPVSVIANASWEVLARGALDGSAQAVVRSGDSTVSQVALPITADGLLELLSHPITIDRWLVSRDTTRARDLELSAVTDSTRRQHLRRIDADLVVPSALGGLALTADVAELGPPYTVSANGVRLTPDSLGRAMLCDPCIAGTRLGIDIEPHGPWWDPPRLRVHDLGWAEIRDGAEWARYFTGDSSLAIPDSTIARQLLRSVLDPSKTAYHALLGEWIARLTPASARIRRDTIDIVGHSHIDAAWLWQVSSGRDAIDATWATVTKLMAKYPDMHFAASSAQYYEWIEEQDPALLARIQALAKSNRWDPVGGWWVESDANIPSGESLVRQALYGQRTFTRLFGKPSRVAWLPNSFGFPWSLPQILRKSGFDYFVTEEMRWNDTNHWPSRLDTFWWEGVDGSRIFTDMIYAYDHDLAPRRLAKEFVVTRDSSASRRMLTVYGVGDHGGGPTMQMLDRARALQRIPTFPVVRQASPESSLARMRLDARAGPVLHDELYLEFHRGTYTTQAKTKRMNRELEALLGTAETAAALANAPYPRDSLRAAWRRVLFNQFHDILPGTSIAEVYQDAARDYAQAQSSARGILEQSLRALAASMNTRPRHGGDTPYLVFNASGRARGGLVRIPLEKDAVAGAVIARDALGHVLPSASLDSALEVRVPNVPALGSALMFVGTAAAPSSSVSALHATGRARVLENDALRVEIDSATGNIARLYDKAHHRESLSPSAGALLLMADAPAEWQAWNIDDLRGKRDWIDQGVRVDSVVRTPLGTSLSVHRERDSIRVAERYTLRNAPARLDISLSIDWRGRERLLKLVVPLAFRVDSTRAEIPYASIARPTRPATRRDSARFETPMQRWLDASSRGFGVAVVNDGKYGYSASGDTLFITLLRSAQWPDPHADIGMQKIELSIVPHRGDWRAPEIREAADELNSPLEAQVVSPHPGSTDGGSWLTIHPSSVELGALKRAEDDDRVIVRLVETSGRPTVAHLRFASPMDASETDLLERDLPNGVRGRGLTLDVPLTGFEIKTIAVRQSRQQ